ncbi:hypothetical protein [Candidatus Macondimonas diazotrophica]|jgi:hypothetical protein|uniref:DNA-binding protein n=1 Tax=Candidatus Macondimonas diazotrophica TaxID=2305248 RepID=A0A4Z0F4Q6_9GAMM|nr:hypothetical protein [Candidatus Macondimonas diazotrophica]TFZ81271.1 hypothetical protein E4680_13115 [Candidatus Macondimonas diazotrophica]
MLKDQLFDVDQAVEHFKAWGILDANAKWVTNLWDRNDLPSVVVKKKRRVPRSQIDKFMERNIRRAS